MKRTHEPRPLGRILFGGALALLMLWLMGALDARSDPVSAFAIGLILFAGLGTLATGVLDAFRVIGLNAERKRAETPTGVFGTAAFATVQECKDAGLTSPDGLFLGTNDGVPLFYNGKAHLVTVAPARQGKGTSAVIPTLLHYEGSTFCIDIKKELYGVTARHRAEVFGHEIVALSAEKSDGVPQSRYNPLQHLIDMAADPRRHHEIGDEAQGIALQLHGEPENGSDANLFFRATTRGLLSSEMMWLALRGKPERCTLPELWRTIKDPNRLRLTLLDMVASNALDGEIAVLGKELLSLMKNNPKIFEDARIGASNSLQPFRPGGPLAEAVSATDFRFEDLKRKKMTAYLMVPPDRIRECGPWVSLLTRQAIRAVANEDSRKPVLFLLDEFANTGKIDGLAEALTLLPGYGVRVWIFVQELSHLRRVYGHEMTNIIMSQAEVKQFFAVQDLDLATKISRMLGDRSVMTRNSNLGRRDTDEIGVSVSERGLPLMSPQQVRDLPSSHQLVLVNGVPPILAEKVRYWEASPWREWADPNPLEGDHPRSGPLAFTLRYRTKGKSHA